jgi:Fe-S-cluster-containing dehydrogenase component
MKCPTNALSISSRGQIIVSPTVCSLCGACEINCPIGAIELFNGFVYVCDLCGGHPRCVEACTEEAIVWEKEAIEVVSLMDYKKESKKLNSGRKRRLFVSRHGDKIRQIWSKVRA